MISESRLCSYIKSAFVSDSYISICDSVLTLEEHNVFNRFLVVDTKGDEIEIPLLGRTYTEINISDNIDINTGESGIDSITIPLYENSLPSERKSFFMCIKELFTNTDYIHKLKKIEIPKGEVYYGGKGIIFDESYTPLLLCVVKARKEHVNNFWKLRIIEPIIYISPKVFREPTKLINRGIIKSLIPAVTEESMSIYARDTRLNSVFIQDTLLRKTIVKVTSLDRFFKNPTKPIPQECINESLNECLVNNIEDIMSAICQY